MTGSSLAGPSLAGPSLAGPSLAGTAAIVAHQGGWDEILLVAGPIVVIVGILALVKRRVEANVAANVGDDPGSGDGHHDHGGHDHGGHDGAGTPPHADGDISSR